MPALPDDFDLFAALAVLVDGDDPKQESLRQIVDAAVALMPGCDTASITLVEGAQTYTPAAVDEIAEQLDAAQYEEDSGPCLSAHRAGEVVHLAKITASRGRYENFCSVAVEVGVVSSLSTPLRLRGRTFGALNCYSFGQGFDADAERTGVLLAVQAAVLLENAAILDRTRLVLHNLNEALESRDIIGQAKGIVMAERKVSAEEAFGLLRARSQELNLKLREVAEDVARTGTLPT